MGISFATNVLLVLDCAQTTRWLWVRFLSSCESDPTLIIINYATQDKKIKVATQTVTSRGRFDLVEVDVAALVEDAATSIKLKLDGRELK